MADIKNIELEIEKLKKVLEEKKNAAKCYHEYLMAKDIDEIVKLDTKAYPNERTISMLITKLEAEKNYVFILQYYIGHPGWIIGTNLDEVILEILRKHLAINDDIERIKLMDEFLALRRGRNNIKYEYKELTDYEMKIIEMSRKSFLPNSVQKNYELFSKSLIHMSNIGPKYFEYAIETGHIGENRYLAVKFLDSIENYEALKPLIIPGTKVALNTNSNRFIKIHETLRTIPADYTTFDLKTIPLENFVFLMKHLKICYEDLCLRYRLFECGRQEIINYILSYSELIVRRKN